METTWRTWRGHGKGPGNEIIMEDELEDQIESMHKQNQLEKKSRSSDLQHESPGERTLHDEYKLQEDFINSKGNKILSHNVLYNLTSFNYNTLMH